MVEKNKYIKNKEDEDDPKGNNSSELQYKNYDVFDDNDVRREKIVREM